MSHVVLERARGLLIARVELASHPRTVGLGLSQRSPSLLQLEWEQGRLRQVWWASVSRVDGRSFLMTSVPRTNLTVWIVV